MMENKYKLGDLFFPVAVAIKDAKDSPYDKFVGLEHYDSLEPVISRYTDTSLLSSSVKEFHAGDMLVARRNVYLRRAGIAFFDGLTSGDSIVLRLKAENELPESVERVTLSRILPFVLNSENFWIYANKHADGMNSKRISIDNLLNYEFYLPSIDEQKVLAEKLWAAYEVKQSYLKMIDATDDMIKAQFIEMLVNKPIDGQISDIIDTKIESVKKTYSLEETIEYIDISSIDSMQNTILSTSQYKVSDAPSRAQQCVRLGDVLVSTVRPVNRNIAVVDVDAENLVASTGFCVLRPLDGYRDYILSIVKSDGYTAKMCDKASGGLYPAVNNGDVLSYKIHLPDEKLLSVVSEIYNQADKSKAELRKSIDAIDKVIKSLINENL